MNQMKIVEGNELAESKFQHVQEKLDRYETSLKLSVILVGDDTSSKKFISKKKDACENLGIGFELHHLNSDISNSKIVRKIQKLNKSSVNGILVQLPLPSHLSRNRIFGKLTPKKDVDCLTPLNQGKLARGSSNLKPAAVEGINYIFESFDINLKGKDITIINNSNLIGKPLAFFLTQKGATVSICHKHTRNLKKYTRGSDILITATGKAGLIGKEHVSKDTFVIDAGYGFKNGKAVGDVKDEVKEVASRYTPVPGGLGPLTVAATMENLIKCYEKQSKK